MFLQRWATIWKAKNMLTTVNGRSSPCSQYMLGSPFTLVGDGGESSDSVSKRERSICDR